MYHVLLPIAESEELARAQAETAADLPCATERVTATVLHVFDDEQTAEETDLVSLDAGRAAVDLLTEADVDVETVTTAGDPERQILRIAEDLDVDMILLGGHRRSVVESILFGSVSHDVAIDSDRPVTITGTGQQVGRRIE